MARPAEDIRILLAAPSPRVLASTKRTLIEKGYRVTAVRDGSAGSEKASTESPDLLITVPDLPHVRGAELAMIARRYRNPVPVIYLVPADDPRPITESEWDSVLRLPFASIELEKEVARLLAAVDQQAPPERIVEVEPPKAGWTRELEATTRPGYRRSEPEVTGLDVPRVDFDLDAPDEVSPPSPPSLGTAGGEIVASGTLEEQPLGTLLIGALETSFTGVLALFTGELEKRIHLRFGRPVYCESNLLVETLGEYLVAEKIVKQQELASAVERMLAGDMQQGEALVSIGVIDREQLVKVIHDHTRAKVVNAFAWKKARYQFELVSEVRSRGLAVEMIPLWLIADGVRRFTAPQAFFQFMDEHQDDYLIPWPAYVRHAGALGAIPGGEELRRSLNGQRTLAEIREASELDDLILAQLIMTLAEGGLISFSDTPSEALVESASGEVIGEMPGPSFMVAEEEPIEFSLDESQVSLREQVLETYVGLPHLDPFALLGVTQDASDEEIATAYAERVAQIGPDRLAKLADSEVQRMGREVYLRLMQAYETLREPGGRERLLDTAGLREAETQTRNTNLAADLHYRQGRHYLEQDNPTMARESFAAAIQTNEREPVYALYCGWATYLEAAAGGDAEGARQGESMLEEALDILPILDDGYLLLARIARDRNDFQAARELIERCLMFNPGSRDARKVLEELRGG